ncbi:glycine betaine ABC transporter substrate-binding protein [Patulibacter defluvii]|uniref:glycine betaine ABC transporter substrate-binding protein n=1 Tax=Patulibacter defluvii TaxID=3095358 RepID=UPI002A74AA77|nr:glycine betaine ABC transporter substrate-binding protein [Patulibacter sp. DM4]
MTQQRSLPQVRLLVLALLALVALLGLAACGDDDKSDGDATSASTASTATTSDSGAAITSNPANAKVKITIGSKNFTEQKVLGEVYAQALQAAGYTVDKQLNLGDEQTALKTLKQGDISAYPEYTGTALLSFFGVKTDALPHDPAAAFAQVKTDFAKDDLVALPPTPFTSSNEVAVTEATAKKYGLTNISDLAKVAKDLTLYGSPECRQRLDCLLGLQKTYGLKFKKFVPVDLSQRSKVLKDGQADVSIVFTTDPQNKREKFVLLKDDKGMFPPYNSTLVVRKDVYDKAGPDLEKAIATVNAKLDADVVQELNARVDLDKETPEQAAGEYLKQFGFVK